MLRVRFSNGLILGGTEYHLQAPITGLDTPPIRNGSGVYAGTDGGFMVSQLYGMRQIVLKGFFIGLCAQATDDLRKGLLERLYMRYNTALVIEDLAGNYWFTQGFVTDVKCDLIAPTHGEFQITILCPDPAIYKADDWLSDAAHEESIPLYVGQETTILRQGDMLAYPEFKLLGRKTNPEILINGERFALTGTFTEGTIIDMKSRQVYNTSGVSLADKRTTDSKWLTLGNGANTIQVNADNIGSNSTESANWHMYYAPGYRGI